MQTSYHVLDMNGDSHSLLLVSLYALTFGGGWYRKAHVPSALVRLGAPASTLSLFPLAVFNTTPPLRSQAHRSTTVPPIAFEVFATNSSSDTMAAPPDLNAILAALGKQTLTPSTRAT